MPRTRKPKNPPAPTPPFAAEDVVCQVTRLSDLGKEAPVAWVLEARRALDAGLQVHRVRDAGGTEALLTSNPGARVGA